ncbi:hypothetical protein ACFPYJ_31720 [Paenibacillus solisilvae]|uniref:Uncharacterized protein n=1 Tax=Paenibacillus solisilvae TaxID=2486751 RepID=A0ABW0W5Y4_9BACL
MSARSNDVKQFYNLDNVTFGGDSSEQLIAYVSPLPIGFKGKAEGSVIVFIDLVFAPATDKQRALLAYLAKLYKAGLIQKDFATATEDQFNQNRQNGKDVIDFQWVSQIINLEKQDAKADWNYSSYFVEDPASGKKPVMFKGPDFALFSSIFSSKLEKEPNVDGQGRYEIVCFQEKPVHGILAHS